MSTQTEELKITNEHFLSVVAQACTDTESVLWTAFFAGDPHAVDSKFWGGTRRPLNGGAYPAILDQKPACDLNTYYSVSSFKPDASGEVKRQKACFDRMNVLVVDDADISTLQGEPSYVVQTSPGKFQIGIFLSADDADCRNIDLCSELVKEMTKRGMVGDRAGNAVTRYVRLPVGANHKPRETGLFSHRVTLWQPEVRMTLAEAAAVVGMDLEEIREMLKAVKERSAASQVSDYRAAVEMGQTQAPGEKMSAFTKAILAGVELHDSINGLAASLVASGASGGSVVNQIRALMEASTCAHDSRWQSRYDDINRAVVSAEAKYKRDRVQAAIEGGRFVVSGDQIINTERKKPLLMRVGDMIAGDVQAPKWVIKGLLEADSLGSLVGAPGDGKSFLSFDMACCVATGTPFHGRKVKQGAVVYLAGEGQGGVARRMRAWETAHGVSLKDAPLYISTRAVSLLTAESAMAVVEEIEAALPEGQKPVLVVIDTVARAFVGGDENSSMDMGMFVNIIDVLLKDRWGAHVLLVHHTGKDASKGGRGSSALKGALDQEFSVEKHLLARKLRCTKMKDAETPPDVAFRLRSIFLAKVIDEFDEEVEITSAVVEMLDAQDMPVSGKRGKNAREEGTLEMTPRILAEVIHDQGWPGFERLRAIFACGGAQVQRLVAEALELNLIAAQGEGRGKHYTIGSSYLLPESVRAL